MILSDFTAAWLRDTYLRGIDLGAAWNSGAANAAIQLLLDTELETVQGHLGVLFRQARVLTAPAAGLILDTDYELTGAVLPFVPLTGGAQVYDVPLEYPQVQWLDRVRVFQGYDLSLAPIYATIPLADVMLSPVSGHLLVPAASVPASPVAQGWVIDYTLGLGQIPAEVAQWIGLTVAMQVLGLAGAGADVSHGLQAESLNHDGVIEQVTYGGGGTDYGVYSGAIKVLKDLRDRMDITRVRMRYQGVRFAPVS